MLSGSRVALAGFEHDSLEFHFRIERAADRIDPIALRRLGTLILAVEYAVAVEIVVELAAGRVDLRAGGRAGHLSSSLVTPSPSSSCGSVQPLESTAVPAGVPGTCRDRR